MHLWLVWYRSFATFASNDNVGLTTYFVGCNRFAYFDTTRADPRSQFLGIMLISVISVLTCRIVRLGTEKGSLGCVADLVTCFCAVDDGTVCGFVGVA